MVASAHRYRYSLRLGSIVLVAFGVALGAICALVAIGSRGSIALLATAICIGVIGGTVLALRLLSGRTLVIDADELHLVGFAGGTSVIDVASVEFVSELRVKTAFAGAEQLLAFWVPGQRSGMRARLASNSLTTGESQRLSEADVTGRSLRPVLIPIEGLSNAGVEHLRAIRAHIDSDQV